VLALQHFQDQEGLYDRAGKQVGCRAHLQAVREIGAESAGDKTQGGRRL
jgi:hypothetical protein